MIDVKLLQSSKHILLNELTNEGISMDVKPLQSAKQQLPNEVIDEGSSMEVKPLQKREPTKGKEENEVLDYYSGEEVMSIYKVKKSWLYTSAKRNQIPMCRIAGKNYYNKRHIDEFFGTAVDLNSITEWVTADDVEEAFSMSKSALRAYTYRHKIPTKREYGRTYYSKEHLEELRRTDLMSDDNYYTTEQVQQLYGLTSANICHIVRVHHISKVKVGVKNLLLKMDVERAMAERAAKGL